MGKDAQQLRDLMTREEWKDLFYELYEVKQLTMKQIADRLDTTKPPLRQVLKEVGISLPRKKKKKSHKFKGEI